MAETDPQAPGEDSEATAPASVDPTPEAAPAGAAEAPTSVDPTPEAAPAGAAEAEESAPPAEPPPGVGAEGAAEGVEGAGAEGAGTEGAADEEGTADEEVAGLRLEVGTDDFLSEAAERVRAILLDHPELERQLPAGDLWLVGFDIIDKEPGANPFFVATVDDARTGRSVTVDGELDDRDSVAVRHRSGQHPPRDAEYEFATASLRDDEDLGAAIAAGALQTYRPLPPLANVVHPDGSADRVVTVGLRASEPGTGPRHRIVGVMSRNGDVVRQPVGVPQPSEDDFGVPIGGGCPPQVGPGQARVRVWRGEELLWELVVVRPSASSGSNGSGVELRQVDFQGRRVLARAHVPMVTVAYDDAREPASAGCGPAQRTWLTEEACFEAEGSDPVPGFRVCSSAPGTILDTASDTGGFRGVALWLAGDELTVVSQMQAGWHRYVTEWRLHGDGTIAARFGVAAVTNPCTGRAHRHHAYWRLDFDIAQPGHNLIQEFNDPPVVGVGNWQTARFEVRRLRDETRQRTWRVRDNRSGMGYWVKPGPRDGSADAYGAGDLWLLGYQEDELDDGQGVTTDPLLSRPGLDRFLSAEPLHDGDVVMWYAAHVSHAAGGEEGSGEGAGRAEPATGGRVGPDLKPFNWRPARAREAYPELIP